MNNATAHQVSSAAPSAGRTIQRTVSGYSAPVFRAFELVRDAVDASGWLHASQLEDDGWVDAHGNVVGACERLAAFQLGIALVARLSTHGGNTSDFRACIHWFGHGQPLPIGASREHWELERLTDCYESLPLGISFRDLLPHIAEVFVTGPTGASRNADKSQRNNRTKKRQVGIFYTPADVADFLAREAVDRWRENGVEHRDQAFRALDPACGTGALLRALAARSCPDSFASTADTRLQFVERSIFGIDLNPIALDASAFVLLAWCLEAGNLVSCAPSQAWTRIRDNLFVGDSAALSENIERASHGMGQQRLALSDTAAADLALRSRVSALLPFDILVANPPFSQSRRQADDSEVRTLTYAPFVKMLWTMIHSRGAGAIVLPLSLAYSETASIASLRSELSRTKGTWHLSFYDRAPDSLFGDDVKTRAAIALVRRSDDTDSCFFTTRLNRWNSRDRARLFSNLTYVAAPAHAATAILPKLGNDLDAELYAALRARRAQPRQHSRQILAASALSSIPTDALDRTLLLGATAYNFLTVQPLGSSPEAISNAGATAWGICYPTEDERWASYALLSSRLVYWLWCVEGDGFHLNQRFVLTLPFTAQEYSPTMAAGGRALWERVRHNPIRSVNKARTTISYSPIAATEELNAIDRHLLTVLGVPLAFVEHLREHQHERVLAGRVGHQRLQHHFLGITPETLDA